MHSPILPIVHAITSDRIREAEAARLVRSIPRQEPQQPRRRISTLAARLAFSTSR